MITASATMKGTLHEEKGIANQDAVCLVEKAGYSCAILGDGVSLKSDWTFSNSEIASAIVTRSAAMYLEEMLKTSLDDQQAMDLVGILSSLQNRCWKKAWKKPEFRFLTARRPSSLPCLKKAGSMAELPGMAEFFMSRKMEASA